MNRTKKIILAVLLCFAGAAVFAPLIFISPDNIYEFYSLGFDEYIPVSAEHGSGISDLLELAKKGVK